jgi:putative protease
VFFDFSPDLRKTFNRDFTSYFLHGRGAPVGALDSPKATGEPVGKVVKAGPRDFTLDGAVEIHRGDGLCFYNSQRQLCGTTVNDVQGRRITPARMEGLASGSTVYRNHDHAFLTTLEKSQTTRRIRVRFRLAAARSGLALLAQDEDGNEAMQVLDIAWMPAEKPEAALATIEKQLGKMGGTHYECTFVRVDVDPVPFLPIAAINGLRRDVLAALDAERQAAYPRWRGGAIKNNIPFPDTGLSFSGNVLNQSAEAFYRRHGVMKIEPAAESGRAMTGSRVMTTKHCIKHQLGWCARHGGTREPLNEPLALIDEEGHRLPLRFRCERCEMEVYFQET